MRRRRASTSSLVEQIEARERDRARQRIRRERMPVEERPAAVVAQERVVDGVGDDRRAQRQVAGGQRLRQADDVRRDAGVLAGEHASGAAEAGQDFVGDHQRAEPVAQAPDAGQRTPPARRSCRRRPAASARRSRPPPYRACCCSVRFEIVQAVDLAPVARRGRAGSDSNTAHARATTGNSSGLKRAREHRLRAHRHRADGVAVIRVMQRDEHAALRLPQVLPVLAARASRATSTAVDPLSE